MYIIDLKKLTVQGDVHQLLRDEKTEEIILFESLDQAIKWCTDNGYELYLRFATDIYNKNYTYKYQKHTENGSSFAYIYQCKMYE